MSTTTTASEPVGDQNIIDKYGYDPAQVVVMVWGHGGLGQLGLGRHGTTSGRILPTPLRCLEGVEGGIVDVAAGESHTVAITEQGLTLNTISFATLVSRNGIFMGSFILWPTRHGIVCYS